MSDPYRLASWAVGNDNAGGISFPYSLHQAFDQLAMSDFAFVQRRVNGHLLAEHLLDGRQPAFEVSVFAFNIHEILTHRSLNK